MPSCVGLPAALPAVQAAGHCPLLNSLPSNGTHLPPFQRHPPPCCLLQNERMHLLTFIQLRQPGFMFRTMVILTQGIFFNACECCMDAPWPCMCPAARRGAQCVPHALLPPPVSLTCSWLDRLIQSLGGPSGPDSIMPMLTGPC